MEEYERQRIREEINGRPLTDFYTLEKSKGANMFCCPICGSGTGKSRTGALSLTKKGEKYIVSCFANNCFNGAQDTLGALRMLWNCGEAEALERCGYDLGEKTRGADTPPKKKATPNPKTAEPEANYTDFYKKAAEELRSNQAARSYLEARGISEATAKHFLLGYCETWKAFTNKSHGSKRLIIPLAKDGYVTRATAEGDPSRVLNDGRKPPFNLKGMKTTTKPYIFVTEGPFDAMSIYEAGEEAIALCGTSSIDFLNAAKDNPEKAYILALDLDEAGDEATIKLKRELEERGLLAICADRRALYSGHKDANEALTSEKEAFIEALGSEIRRAEELQAAKAEEIRAELYKRTGPGMLDSFLEEIQTKRYEPIPTGIKAIDRALNGGLIRKTLVTLGAAPGMGKTAIAQWMLENIAQSGREVLYFNLEMDRSQLLARSLARMLYKYAGGLKNTKEGELSTIDILRGYNWTPKQRNAVEYAANLYRTKIAPYFIYNPEGVTNSLSSILEACKEEANRLKAEGKAAPVICIDYLQLIDYDLQGEKERKPEAIEGLKRSIVALKGLAKEFDTCVIVIIAHNRASNKEGRATMESGRDTSVIEYTGDVMLGLSYTAIEDHETYIAGTYKTGDRKGEDRHEFIDMEYIQFRIDEADKNNQERPEIANRLCLKILKSRFSEPGRKARFIFDGKHNNFIELDETRKDPTQKVTPYNPTEIWEVTDEEE